MEKLSGEDARDPINGRDHTLRDEKDGSGRAAEIRAKVREAARTF